MAELEKAENGDVSRSRMWLMRAMGEEHGPSAPQPAPRPVEPLPPISEPIPEPLPARQ